LDWVVSAIVKLLRSGVGASGPSIRETLSEGAEFEARVALVWTSAEIEGVGAAAAAMEDCAEVAKAEVKMEEGEKGSVWVTVIVLR
jgi:hypothetical protein